MLTKTSFIFLIYLLPFPFLIYNYKNFCNKKSLYTIFLLGVSVFLAIVFYTPIVKAQNYQIVLGKNATFIYPFHEWLHLSFQLKMNIFNKNFFLLLYYLSNYLQLPFFLTAFFVIFDRKYSKEKRLLLLYFFIPFSSLMIFGRSFHLAPRYIYFIVIFLIPLCAIGLENITLLVLNSGFRKYLPFIYIIVFFYPFYSCLTIIINPLSSPLNTWDKKEYFNLRGFYIMETINSLKKDSQNKEFAITTDGVLGLLPEAFQISFHKNSHILIEGYYPITTVLP